MSWTYRVMHHAYTHQDGSVEEWYEVHEVYTDPSGWTNPIAARGETVEDLRADLEAMLRALDLPVLEYEP